MTVRAYDLSASAHAWIRQQRTEWELRGKPLSNERVEELAQIAHLYDELRLCRRDVALGEGRMVAEAEQRGRQLEREARQLMGASRRAGRARSGGSDPRCADRRGTAG